MYPTGSDDQHTLVAVWNTKPTILTIIITLLFLLSALATTFCLQLLSGLFNCERVGAGERGLFDVDGNIQGRSDRRRRLPLQPGIRFSNSRSQLFGTIIIIPRRTIKLQRVFALRSRSSVSKKKKTRLDYRRSHVSIFGGRLLEKRKDEGSPD